MVRLSFRSLVQSPEEVGKEVSSLPEEVDNNMVKTGWS